jgi:hypothetical protein
MTFPAALAHGPITRVADGVHVVRGTFKMRGMRIGRTMTIVEGDDGLVILNAVRLDASGEAELERLGKVAHLVKLSDSHGLDEPYYADRFKPVVWTLEGASVAGATSTKQLGPETPLSDGTLLRFPGATAWKESAMHIARGGGTLVTCDAIQNHADADGVSFMGRLMMPILGFKGGVISAPMWRRFQKMKGAAVTAAYAPVVERSFANLVTGHGPAHIGGADEQVRAAVARAAG